MLREYKGASGLFRHDKQTWRRKRCCSEPLSCSILSLSAGHSSHIRSFFPRSYEQKCKTVRMWKLCEHTWTNSRQKSSFQSNILHFVGQQPYFLSEATSHCSHRWWVWSSKGHPATVHLTPKAGELTGAAENKRNDLFHCSPWWRLWPSPVSGPLTSHLPHWCECLWLEMAFLSSLFQSLTGINWSLSEHRLIHPPPPLCSFHNWISANIGTDGGQLFDCGNVFSAAHDAKSFTQNTMFKQEDILV